MKFILRKFKIRIHSVTCSKHKGNKINKKHLLTNPQGDTQILTSSHH